MKETIFLTASLVIYKNPPTLLKAVVASLFSTPLRIQLCAIDNSPTDCLRSLFISQSNIEYYYNNGQNLGFGKAHNLALTKLPHSDYHLVLNPDIYFQPTVIPELIQYLEEHQDIGLIQPKIYYPHGELQYLCKRYPSLFLLFARRFIPKRLQKLFQQHMDWYEMRDTGYNQLIDVPYLSGCFMLFRKAYLEEIRFFDEWFFMYLEDADISLRMAQKYRSVFYPHVFIYHHWAKGSYKSLRLTLISIQSTFYFFNKHGWKFF